MSLQSNLTVFDGKMTARIYSTAKARALSPGDKLTYCFTLTLTNWLGQTSKSAECYKFEQISGIPTPELEVEHAYSGKQNSEGVMELKLSDNLLMAAKARASSCAGNSSVRSPFVPSRLVGVPWKQT
jgi:hypothetical protein